MLPRNCWLVAVSGSCVGSKRPNRLAVLTDRRPVRATYGCFEDLDRQLGSERGPNGEPSRADFQTIELLRVVDRFAVQFDDLPELIPGRSDYRVLLTSGVLVRALNVVGHLASDGAIALVSIDIDLSWD